MNISSYRTNWTETSARGSKNNEQFDVLVLYKASEVINDSNQSLLEKITTYLSTIGQNNIERLALTSTQAIPFNIIIKQKNASIVLCFGLKPSDLHLNIKLLPYQPLFIHKYTIVFSHSLSDLNDNQGHKRNLWSAFKMLFPSI